MRDQGRSSSTSRKLKDDDHHSKMAKLGQDLLGRRDQATHDLTALVNSDNLPSSDDEDGDYNPDAGSDTSSEPVSKRPKSFTNSLKGMVTYC